MPIHTFKEPTVFGRVFGQQSVTRVAVERRQRLGQSGYGGGGSYAAARGDVGGAAVNRGAETRLWAG